MSVRRVVVPLSGSDVERLEALVAEEERIARAALGPHESPRPIDERGHLVGQAETVRRLIRRAAAASSEDVFTCRHCGDKVDYLKPYHSDERGLWHWDCPKNKENDHAR